MFTFRLGRFGINLFNAKKVLTFLCLFLLVFPKGGFKIGEIPITWGYLSLGAVSLYLLNKDSLRVQLSRLSTLICLLPFQIIVLLALIINGAGSLGMTVSFLISFFFLPFIFLFALGDKIERLDLSHFFSLFKKGVLFIACYGIFLFIFKQTTGKFIEIPFLTTNFNDLGELEEKCIDRGTVFKLISTYNNGNIYGVCLLMLMPLYSLLERKTIRTWIVKTSLLLTFSRTVWIGLLINEIFCSTFLKKKDALFFIKISLAILFLLSFAAIVFNYYGFDLNFIFDLNFGGRKDQFEALENPKILPHTEFSAILEIVYMSILSYFGIFGLAAFLLAMAYPIISNIKTNNPIKKSIALGMINYLIISMSDGALQFIPTMAFYWFLASLIARKNFPQEEGVNERPLSTCPDISKQSDKLH